MADFRWGCLVRDRRWRYGVEKGSFATLVGHWRAGGVEWPSAPLVQINDRDWIRALLRQAVTDMPKNLADGAGEGSSLTHRAAVAIRELGVKSKLHDCDEDPVAAATHNRGSAVCQAVVSLSIL